LRRAARDGKRSAKIGVIQRGEQVRRAITEIRGRAGPRHSTGQGSGVTVDGGVHRGCAVGFIQPPVTNKIGFVARERQVFLCCNFRSGQRAAPQSHFIHLADEGIAVGQRAHGQRRGGSHRAGRTHPIARSDGSSVEKDFSASRIHDQRGLMPASISDYRPSHRIDRLVCPSCRCDNRNRAAARLERATPSRRNSNPCISR